LGIQGLKIDDCWSNTEIPIYRGRLKNNLKSKIQRAAIEVCNVDYVLPLEEIGKLLKIEYWRVRGKVKPLAPVK
jgi:hypothetical protein